MNSIRCLYGITFGGFAENLAFQGIEFHGPIFLPLLRSVRVMLKISGVRLSFYVPYNRSTGLNPMISFIIYKAYVRPCLLYGLDVLIFRKGQLNQF